MKETELFELLASGIEPINPFFQGSSGIKFVYVPSGNFLMGSNRDRCEQPIHRVSLRNGYFVSKTPITQSQWKSVMGDNPSYFVGDDLPVHCITWYDSRRFCERLAEIDERPIRLLTEAEWEFACRAGTSSKYNTGKNVSSLREAGWFAGNIPKNSLGVQPVGKKLPNAWGLQDMHGNVHEWCFDGLVGYPAEETVNPVQRTRTTKNRILRGGSWGIAASDCTSTSRYFYPPGFSNFGIGLRVCFQSSFNSNK